MDQDEKEIQKELKENQKEIKKNSYYLEEYSEIEKEQRYVLAREIAEKAGAIFAY